MKTKRMIRRTFLAMAIAALGATGTALAIPEGTEANQPIQSAQPLTVGSGGTITVDGTIAHPGSNNPDVDFYSFEVQEGDVVTVNIDGTTNELDASLTLFGPGSAYPVVVFSSDASLDSGSTTEADPRIDPLRLAAGRYTVAVSSFPVFFRAGGTMTSTKTLSSGAYKLIISGITPPVQYINIDIKPGNDQETRINPKAKGVIPVALLSSKDFDPMDVDVSSMTFGCSGDEPSLRHCQKQGHDVNGDGRPDLVCHFDNERAKFVRGDSMGRVKGKTKQGKAFEGSGNLKVMPEKRGE